MKKSKKKSRKIKKIFFVFPLILILLISFLFFRFNQDPFFKAKTQMHSLSKGDQYFGRLSLWYLYAKSGNWSKAYDLEPKLDPVDIQNYKNSHDPQKIAKTLENVKSRKNKIAEDWLEIARLQIQLNQKQEAIKSLSEARKLDPVRDDITSLLSLF